MEPLTHLQRLEAESIHIIREVVAECEHPVMLYSIGKDSAVMLHLAMKAFYPARPPFPLMHIDTTWKFREMIRFRDETVRQNGLELIVHTNPRAFAKGVGPFTHGSAIHTDIMKTQALKQALDMHGFDAAFGGARRDEEKSRAKERVFSFRSAQHRWDPKNQRPELWRVYNTRINKGESIRVFPISNWTELDIWQYIYLEDIPIVPLYFAARRRMLRHNLGRRDVERRTDAAHLRRRAASCFIEAGSASVERVASAIIGRFPMEARKRRAVPGPGWAQITAPARPRARPATGPRAPSPEAARPWPRCSVRLRGGPPPVAVRAPERPAMPRGPRP